MKKNGGTLSLTKTIQINNNYFKTVTDHSVKLGLKNYALGISKRYKLGCSATFAFSIISTLCTAQFQETFGFSPDYIKNTYRLALGLSVIYGVFQLIIIAIKHRDIEAKFLREIIVGEPEEEENQTKSEAVDDGVIDGGVWGVQKGPEG